MKLLLLRLENTKVPIRLDMIAFRLFPTSTPFTHAVTDTFLFVQISKGLLEKYGPERVLDTPITEVHKITSLSFINLVAILDSTSLQPASKSLICLPL